MRVVLGVILIVIGLFVLFVTVSPFSVLQTENSGDSFSTGLVPYDSMEFSSTSVDWIFNNNDHDTMSIELVNHRKNINIFSKERNGTLVIEVKEPRFSFLRFGYSKTKAIVSLPKTYTGKVDIATVSGSINLEDEFTTKHANIKTVSGDVKGNALESELVTIKTTSGDIRYKKVASEQITFDSVSGDIVADSVMGPVEGKTVSGDIDLRFDEENKSTQLKTVSGDVDIHVRNGNTDLDIQTVSGDIHVGHLLQTKMQSKKMTGQLGEGQYPMNIKTTSGDIRIHER